jgi:uncharacterized phage protein (TIGR01671 family)
MRQLKFRAWNLHTKKMLMPSDVSTMPMMPEIRHSGGSTGTVYLQWTGLLDKNGKEIYEGDIVRMSDDFLAFFDIDPVAPITFWRGQFYANKNCENRAGLSVIADVKGETARCEIIGNIYENSDLLV